MRYALLCLQLCLVAGCQSSHPTDGQHGFRDGLYAEVATNQGLIVIL